MIRAVGDFSGGHLAVWPGDDGQQELSELAYDEAEKERVLSLIHI